MRGSSDYAHDAMGAVVFQSQGCVPVPSHSDLQILISSRGACVRKLFFIADNCLDRSLKTDCLKEVQTPCQLCYRSDIEMHSPDIHFEAI